MRRTLDYFGWLVVFMVMFLCGCASTPSRKMSDLKTVLNKHGDKFNSVLAKAEEQRVQILISEVVTNSGGRVQLKRSGYRVDAEYFYPASSIKLCAAVAALQTIEQLQTKNHTADLLEVPLEIAPLFPGDPLQHGDESNLAGGGITVGNEIRKLALVSDNQAFNRLYDLVGHERLNRNMHELGLHSVVVNHRLSESRAIPNPLATAEVKFKLPHVAPLTVPARVSKLSLANSSKDLLLGVGYIKGDKLVNEPMDFSRRNGISLVDLQDLLVKVARPDIALGTPALKLREDHRAKLLQAMTQYPRESVNPLYTERNYPDDCSKFLLPGFRRVFSSKTPGERVESTGKTGRAYGFSVENSYLHNPKNGRAVFVTAVIYTNADGVLNDDKYEYDSVADPFLADLGEIVAREWLSDSTR